MRLRFEEGGEGEEEGKRGRSGTGRGGITCGWSERGEEKDGLNEICRSEEGFKVHVLTVSDLLTLSAAWDS